MQERSKSQFLIYFRKYVKSLMIAKGWNKGDKIAIYEHGKGFFIERTEGKVADDLERYVFGIQKLTKHDGPDDGE